MSTEAPALRTLAHQDLLPAATLVLGSLSAAGYLAGYATAAGSNALIAAALVTVLGPLVGLKHIDRRARALEPGDA